MGGKQQDLSLDNRRFILKRIAGGTIDPDPYPHYAIDGIFPRKFYRKIMQHRLPLDAYHRMSESRRTSADDDDHPYANRYRLDPNEPPPSSAQPADIAFWEELGAWLRGSEFVTALLQKFMPYVRHQFGADLANTGFVSDIQIIRDFTGYELGPHTDAPQKVVVMIFYLPETPKDRNLGTSIYVPAETGFRCRGGPHYPHDQFRRVKTMDYVPNSALCFLKTDNSFHGVEPVTETGKQRDLIQLSILSRTD